MSQIARIAVNQQVTFADYQRFATAPRDMLDMLISAAIETGQAYSGGTVTRTATTKVTVATPLYVFKLGALYSRMDDNGIELDFLAQLPTAGNKRIVAIVAQGAEASDEVEERDFFVRTLPDGTDEVEAQPTATILWRKVEVSAVYGAAAPDPARPAVDAALTVLAWVTLTSSEVSAAIEQNTVDRVVPLNVAVERLGDVEDFAARTGPVIDGMKADIATLYANSKNVMDRASMRYIMEQLARVTEKSGVAQTAAYSRTDFYLEPSKSDTANVNYLAKVEEGIRFDDANKDTTNIVLSNPGDTTFVVHANGLLLPKYDTVPLISVWGKDNEVALSNAGSQTINMVQRTVSRSRLRVGDIFTVCSNSQYWQTGRVDWAKMTFEQAGETFNVVGITQDAPNHYWYRLQKVWIDNYEETYWTQQTVTASYTGNIAAETFKAPRTAWCVGVNLGFSRLDSAGDLRLMLAQVNDSAAPDVGNVLATVNVPVANLKLWPAKTTITIPPTLLEAGKRYAWIVVTAGNHWLAITEGNKYAGGSYFTSTDGAWFQGDISRDIALEVLIAQFQAPRLVVNLENWNLDGGVAGLDLLLTKIEPDEPIVFEVKKSGGSWVPLTATGIPAGNVFAGLPAALDARMVLSGTTDLMPGIFVGGTPAPMLPSKVTKRRPRTTATHITTVETTPSTVTSVDWIVYLESFDAVHHTCTAKLLRGAGYTTEVSPAATVDETLPDGSIKRRFTFTGLSLTQYKLKTVLGTDSALLPFHVAEATTIGYP